MSLSISNEHNCFRNRYSMPLKRMFGDRNVVTQSFFSPEFFKNLYQA